MESVTRKIYLLRNGVQTLEFVGSHLSKYSNPITLNLESFKTCYPGLDSSYDLEKIIQISEAFEEAAKLTNVKLPYAQWIMMYGKYDSSLDELIMFTHVSSPQPFFGKLASILPSATVSIRGTMMVLTSSSKQNLATAGPSSAQEFSITGIQLKERDTSEKEENMGDEYISNGRIKVEFKCSVILEWEESFGRSGQTFGHNIVSLSELWNEIFMRDYDCVIVASNKKEFKCHSDDLTKNSNYIHGLLEKMKKENTPLPYRIEMKDMGEVGVNLLLHFMYERYVDLGIGKENDILELMGAAQQCGIPELQELIAQFLYEKPSEWFSTNGLVDFYLRSLYKFKGISEKLLSLMRRIPQPVLDSNAFKELVRNNPDQAHSLRDKDLGLPPNNNNEEVEAAGAVMRECRRDKRKRSEKVSDSSPQHSKIMRLENDEQSSSETDSDSSTDDYESSDECEDTRQGKDEDKFGEDESQDDEEEEFEDGKEEETLDDEEEEEEEETREAQRTKLGEDDDVSWWNELRERNSNMMDNRYTIQNQNPLGAGSFGVVVHVINHVNNQPFAVKIVKDLDPEEAKKELNLLKDIRDRQSKEEDKSRIITLHDHFLYGEHQCMVFKLLEMSLYDYIHKYNGKPTPTPFKIVKLVGYQSLQAFEFLANFNVVHADLKPDNIMIEDLSTFRIKLIDFGNCLEVKDDLHESGVSYSSFQAPAYRAPEVILGVKYNDRLDMWGLACTLFELRTGRVLFDGNDEIAQLKKMIQVHSTKFPNALIRKAPRRDKFFERKGDYDWTFLDESTTRASYDPGQSLFNQLTKGTEEESLPFHNCSDDLKRFISALKRMLSYDMNKRVSAKEAKKFDFFEKVRETLETTK